eukprot:scaffold2325_cov374-Prasinococcus_capsulatus_cf.AAC.11
MTDTKGEAAKDEGEASQFFQAYEQSKDKPCYVYDVNVKGNARTKRYLIDRELEVRYTLLAMSSPRALADCCLTAASGYSPHHHPHERFHHPAAERPVYAGGA